MKAWELKVKLANVDGDADVVMLRDGETVAVKGAAEIKFDDAPTEFQVW